MAHNRISEETRARILEDVRAGHSQSEAARRNGVSQGFVCKLLDRCDFGSYPPYILPTDNADLWTEA